MSWLAIPRVWAARDLQERNDRMEQQTGPITAAQLFEVHYDTVFRYISRRVFRREEAEDLAEEVFATAFGALARFRARCEPRLWLLSISETANFNWVISDSMAMKPFSSSLSSRMGITSMSSQYFFPDLL